MATIFISYPQEDAQIARELYYALTNLTHNVCFDKAGVQIGDEYNFWIIDNIRKSDFAILLISPEFFADGSYCRTELKIIKSNWPIPAEKVFPVLIREVDFQLIPEYIKSISILKVEGNPVGEIVKKVQDKLYGFKDSDSVSKKISDLEIMNKLETIDLEWLELRKNYMLTWGNEKVIPDSSLLAIPYTALIFMSIIWYASSNDILMGMIPLSLCILSYFIMRFKSKKYENAKKKYLMRREEISKDLS